MGIVIDDELNLKPHALKYNMLQCNNKVIQTVSQKLSIFARLRNRINEPIAIQIWETMFLVLFDPRYCFPTRLMMNVKQSAGRCLLQFVYI